MTLDELVGELRGFPQEALLAELAGHIEAWKSDDRDVNALEVTVDRFFGNSWIPDQETHAKAMSIWKSFKDDAIRGIGGMTMNERLFLFGLFTRFKACRTPSETLPVYQKLLAEP